MRRFGLLLLIGLFLPLCLASPAVAQEPDDAIEAPPQVLGTGLGIVDLEGRKNSLPYTRTVFGPVVALQPIVDLLGGVLRPGPLGESFTLVLGEDEIVIGAESTVMTLGQTIEPLSRPPLITISGVQVPLDFLERTYGSRLGFDFRWVDRNERLMVRRFGQSSYRVTIDTVQISVSPPWSCASTSARATSPRTRTACSRSPFSVARSSRAEVFRVATS